MGFVVLPVAGSVHNVGPAMSIELKRISTLSKRLRLICSILTGF